ncbi:MAG: hypothetical protein ACRDN0_07590, partial [Trebonia sp.]
MTVALSPRAIVLAASVSIRHVTDDPVRALTLAWRALPPPFRGWLRFAGLYGRAAALWGAGERRAALTALEAKPAHLAAFSLAVDQPQVARSALARLPIGSPAGPVLQARLAYREGRLDDAMRALDGAPGGRARRLRAEISAENDMLELPRGDDPPAARPIASDRIGRAGGRGGRAGELGRTAGRVLHIVTDALPSTSAGYTVRTQEITLAQRAAGLDPHVTTRIGFPVTSGAIDGRPLVTVDGVPYHR